MKIRKKRATFTTDADLWEELSNILRDKGYPQGAIGYYLTTCLHALYEQVEMNNEKQMLLFTLEELRRGN